jgi:hypothetical protein
VSEKPQVVNKPVALSPDGDIIVLPLWFFKLLSEAVKEKNTGSITVNFVDGGFSTGEIRKMAKRNGNGNHH